MEDHNYKVVELVGSSQQSIEDAIQHAITRAGRTLHGLRWFQLMETRGRVENDKVTQYQVVLKVGFHLDEPG
jgi:flavin-binding protein dodecin